MSQARGPYEILVTDPGEEPSPPPSSAQRANDIARTIREYGNAAPIPIDDNWTYFEVGHAYGMRASIAYLATYSKGSQIRLSFHAFLYKHCRLTTRARRN